MGWRAMELIPCRGRRAQTNRFNVVLWRERRQKTRRRHTAASPASVVCGCSTWDVSEVVAGAAYLFELGAKAPLHPRHEFGAWPCGGRPVCPVGALFSELPL